jgi:hypothetical protein
MFSLIFQYKRKWQFTSFCRESAKKDLHSYPLCYCCKFQNKLQSIKSYFS